MFRSGLMMGLASAVFLGSAGYSAHPVAAADREVLIPGGSFNVPEALRAQVGGLKNKHDDFEVYADYIPEFNWVDVQGAARLTSSNSSTALSDACAVAAGFDKWTSLWELQNTHGITCYLSSSSATYSFAVPKAAGAGAGKGVIQFSGDNCGWMVGATGLNSRCSVVIDGTAYPLKKQPPRKYRCSEQFDQPIGAETYPPMVDRGGEISRYRWCVPVPKEIGTFDIQMVGFEKGKGSYVSCSWSFSRLTCGSYFEADYRATARIRAKVSKSAVKLSCYFADSDRPNRPAKKDSCRTSYDWWRP